MKVVIEDSLEVNADPDKDVWHINSLGIYNGTWVRVSTDPMLDLDKL